MGPFTMLHTLTDLSFQCQFLQDIECTDTMKETERKTEYQLKDARERHIINRQEWNTNNLTNILLFVHKNKVNKLRTRMVHIGELHCLNNKIKHVITKWRTSIYY